MRKLVQEEQQKLEKKGKSSDAIAKRYELCDLVDAHIQECEAWQKGVTFASPRDDPKKRALLK